MTVRDENLFDREGHLTELTVDRYLVGELSGQARLEEHIAQCEVCRAQIDACKAFDASFSITPPAHLADRLEQADTNARVVRLSDRTRRGGWFAGAGGIVAAAAALLLWFGGSKEVTRPEPAPEVDTVRIKGKGFDLEVFAHDGERTRPVDDGDVVRPGERLGFKIRARTEGHVMIAGVDGAGSVYACYPQRTPKAVLLEASPKGRDLEAAIRLDDVAGHERLVAFHCPEPFAFDEVRSFLGSGADAPAESKLDTCRRDEVLLRKEVE